MKFRLALYLLSITEGVFGQKSQVTFDLENYEMEPYTKNGLTDYYAQQRKDVENLIPHGAKRILDIGCGEGILGERLLKNGAEEVVGIEIEREIANKARKRLSSVICGDVEKISLPFPSNYFDVIIMADVLEHLKEPFSALLKVRDILSEEGHLILSVPNVRYYAIINMAKY